MTPERWALYLDLQTTWAYRDAHPAPVNRAVLQASVRFFESILGSRPARTLVLGPWGLTEVVAWMWLSEAVDVLTAYAPEADEMARHFLAGTPSIHVGDMHAMSFSSETFDVLYASNVLEHALAPYIALMECRRVLKPGGRALFTVPSFEGPEGGVGPFHLHCLDVSVWRELLRKTGLAVRAEWAVPGGHIGSIAVQELLAAHPEGSFETRTGCVQYSTLLCEAIEPPAPHNRILDAVRAHVAS